MVLFNYSTKEITAKIVYYGPGLCGKTTNLQFVYDNLPKAINKGKMLSLATKTDRTLFFDFLPIDLGTIRGMRTRLQLYTVPGQVFYNTTRKLVLKGADGVVFVADSQKRMLDANLESLKNLEENLAEHDMKLAEMPLIVQFNKRDLADVGGVEELNAAINKYNAPIYEAVATTGIGVHETLKAITRLVLNSLKERYADRREQRAEPAPGLTAAAMAAARARTRSATSGAEADPGAAVRVPAAAAPPPPLVAVQARAGRGEGPFAPAPPSEPFDVPPSEETPTLDFSLPELEAAEDLDFAAPAGMEALSPEPPIPAPFQETRSEEPFPLAREEPFEIFVEPETGTGPLAGEAPVEPNQGGPPDLESALELEMAGEDFLELVEEEPVELSPATEPVLDEAAPLLDVTEELLPADQPFRLDAEPAGPASIPATEAPPTEMDSMEVDLLETPELPAGTVSAKMAAYFDAALPVGDPRSFEPAVPAAAGTPVAEIHHAESFTWSPPSHDPAPAIPRVEEGPAPPAIDGRTPVSVERPMVPFAPMEPAREGPAVVRAVSAAELLSREIHLPIRLEIGGQSISFELKISLDLAAAAAGRRPGADGGGDLS